MKILFFDTETTGLQEKNIVQFGGAFGEYILHTDETKGEKKIDLLFNPGCKIPAESSNIHGITDEHVKDRKGFNTYFEEFFDMVKESDYVVGHNINFDISAIEYELKKHNEYHKYEKDVIMLKEKSLCTMLSSIELCKIPSTSYKSKYKWPKLTELHTTLYGESFDNAHNAFADIMATKKCFMGLVKLGHITI